jgi:RNA polymerase sigma factor (sigma-70 family)
MAASRSGLPSDVVERIVAGDREAENDLVRYFGPRVFAMLCARMRDREVARDLTQDVQLAIIRALRQNQLREADKLQAFVLSVARNIMLSYLRDRQRASVEEPLDSDPPAPFQEDLLEVAERQGLVREALSRLETVDREILMRTLAGEQKPGAIAQDLGMSPELVRQRKSRAIKKIAEFVKRLSRTPAALRQE